jgi:hypothetical protein
MEFLVSRSGGRPDGHGAAAPAGGSGASAR